MACGALARHVAEIAAEQGWPVDVHPLPPLLHNRPERIAPAVRAAAGPLRERYAAVAVGFADCGSYGALDEVCAELGLPRLPGQHCYELFAGPAELEQLVAEEPGSYLLTDFLVRSFRRTVLAELGLDRYPELRADYFGHYRRVVWLAQHPTPELHQAAAAAAAALGLPLEVRRVGSARLAAALQQLLAALPVTPPHRHRQDLLDIAVAGAAEMSERS